ncbi:MAG: glucose-6-phosphate isomerase [Phascolarctobacterium sp.]|nr:glucose-6-phosphate isomerase [Phascolarctobacterium sp.]
MLDRTEIRLPSGFVVDYATMLGPDRIDAVNDLNEIAEKAEAAEKAVSEMRYTGNVKNHRSKGGDAERIWFTRLPYVRDGNPNTPESIGKLKELSASMKRNADGVLFLGVGGAYLGNRVLFDVFCGDSWNSLIRKEVGYRPCIFFGGNNADPLHTARLAAQIKSIAARSGESFRLLIIPISKSGTTLETLTAFNYFYSAFRKSNIIIDVAVVTEASGESTLYDLALENGWRIFDIKEGIGGRFSVLHNPGLVAAAAIGLDIEQLLLGAREMDKACRGGMNENPALLNACLKYIAAAKYGCDIEVFMGYGMCLKSLGEWYVQLLAESLGKRNDREGREVFYGRTPIAAVGTTDMHAQTQEHQDGKRNKVVQFLQVENMGMDITVPGNFPNVPAFYRYKGLAFSNALKEALKANREALDGDRRFSALYVLPNLSEYSMGQILYFLMLSIAYEGELADVDAYDQPGVEVYKKIMKRILS